MVEIEEKQITTADGIQLSTLILTPKTNKPKAIIQLNSGTVTKKEYYLKLATYISEQNYIVVLFDYRGVGDSRPKTLKGFNASIADWGKYDANAVSLHVQDQYPHLEKHLLAHSMGGQIYGMMENWQMFEKVIMLTTSSGNFNRFTPTSHRLKVKWSSIILFPLLNTLFGYIPGSFGVGEDWPKGVANDWLTNSRANGLMPSYLDKKSGISYYSKVDKKITAWYFPDDTMSTKSTISELSTSYPKADINIKIIEPSTVGLDKIGHFGIFKSKSNDRLWPMLIEEIEK